MSIGEGFDKLKALGAQKIHEKTHIAKYHVQSLLHNNFDEMTKIQFLGFVSILEREYGVHLDDLRERGLDHFSKRRMNDEDNKVFLQPKKSKSNGALYIFLLLVLVILGMVYTFSNTNKESQHLLIVEENKTIKIVQEEILKIAPDTNDTDANISEEIDEADVVVPQISFKVFPNAKLWLGYIDLKTHRKFQVTTSEPIVLDPQKDWLLSLGHGDVSVEVNGVLHKFNSANNIRFLYKNNEFQEISFQEFKNLNKGAVW